MIQLCSRTVLTHSDDGTTGFFQSDILQQKIEKSCLASGLNAPWIAEDIALSVEYSLGEIGRDKIFTDSEIDAVVVKILHEAGLGTVATHYQLDLANKENDISFAPSNIKDIVDRYLHIESPELEYIVDKVVKAGKKLLLKDASPTLILELAKHYLHSNIIKDASFLKKEAELCPWLISKEDILSETSGKTAVLINSEIIELSGISRLFPSIRIKIRFANFADFLGFTPPVPELVLFSSLHDLASSIDNLIDTTEKIASRISQEKENLPVYLMFSDAPEFTEHWLGGNWNDNKHCFEDLVAELKGQLTNQVFTYT